MRIGRGCGIDGEEGEVDREGRVGEREGGNDCGIEEMGKKGEREGDGEVEEGVRRGRGRGKTGQKQRPPPGYLLGSPVLALTCCCGCPWGEAGRE